MTLCSPSFSPPRAHYTCTCTQTYTQTPPSGGTPAAVMSLARVNRREPRRRSGHSLHEVTEVGITPALLSSRQQHRPHAQGFSSEMRDAKPMDGFGKPLHHPQVGRARPGHANRRSHTIVAALTFSRHISKSASCVKVSQSEASVASE